MNLKEEVKKQNTPDVRIGDDELFEKAKQLVIEAGKASTSFLQRKLGVGYARASSLIDRLEAKGIVQSAKGSNPRSVNPTAVSKPKIWDGKKHKILIIDDDEFLLNMYKIKFEQIGFKVETLSNGGGDIVNRINDIKPDLISLDIVMPERDGFQVMELLKKDTRTKDIPVIFLTNQGAEQDVKKGIATGAVDYLICAQITPPELIETYTRFLSNPKEYIPKYRGYLK